MSGSEGTAGRFVADALAAAGVRVAFTVPGESFLPLLDGLTAAGIRVVAARHEGAAGFMATAHGALTGRPAAVLVTRAVGAANLSIALHAAQADSVPLIAIVGQVDRPARGREAFQEADLVAVFGGLCRWAREVRDVAALPGALDEALRRATTGRPGPVLLSLPEDLLDEPAPVDGGRVATATVLGPPRAPEPDPTTVRRILHLLLDAERPVILAGAGVLRSRATADLVRLAEMVDVPVVAAWRRPDVFPNDHALYLGMSGYFAAPTVHPRLLEADALLVLGCRLNEVASHGWSVPAPGARWAHVDLEPLGARGSVAAPTIALASDARTFVREARRVLGGGVLAMESLERRRDANAVDRLAYETARAVDIAPWDGPGVHPGRVVAALGRLLPPDAIVTTDAGHFGGWAARGLWLRRPGTYLGPTAGAMGYGLPAAIAASLASPGRPVVALVGDGGLGHERGRAGDGRPRGRPPRRARLRQRPLRHDPRSPGPTRAWRPSPPTSARSTGRRSPRASALPGVRVESDDAFEPALRAALGSRRPTVLHLVVDRRWVSVDRVDDEQGAAVPAPEAEAEPAEAGAPSPSPRPTSRSRGGPSPSPTSRSPRPSAPTPASRSPSPRPRPSRGDARARARSGGRRLSPRPKQRRRPSPRPKQPRSPSAETEAQVSAQPDEEPAGPRSRRPRRRRDPPHGGGDRRRPRAGTAGSGHPSRRADPRRRRRRRGGRGGGAPRPPRRGHGLRLRRRRAVAVHAARSRTPGSRSPGSTPPATSRRRATSGSSDRLAVTKALTAVEPDHPELVAARRARRSRPRASSS